MFTFPIAPSGVNIVPSSSGTSSIGTSDIPFDILYVNNIVSTGATAEFVNVAGDTMTGDLTLNTKLNTNTVSGNSSLTLRSPANLTVSVANNVDFSTSGLVDFYAQGDMFISAGYPSTPNKKISLDLYGTTGGIEANALTSGSTIVLNSDTVIDLNPRSGGLSGAVNVAGNFLPDVSGTRSIGLAALPFASGVFNNFVTSMISGTVTASTHTINWASGASQILTWQNGNPSGCTITLVGGNAGSNYTLQTVNSASGTSAITWGGSNILWQAGASGTTTSSANAIDLFSFYYNGNKYLSSFSTNYA